MNIYYKFFIGDSDNVDFFSKNLINKHHYYEIANYKRDNNVIKDIDLINNFDKNKIIYHSMNRFFAIFYPYSLKETSFYTNQLHKWQEYWLSEFEYCNSLGSSKIIIHFINSTYGSSIDKVKNINKNNLESYKYLFELSKKYNIKIFFENSFERTPEEFDIALNLCKQFGVEFGVCFDIGHMNIWGTNQATSYEWISYIEDLNKSFDLHFHFHTNDGLFDEHRPISPCIEKEDYKDIKLAYKLLLDLNIVKNVTLEIDEEFFLNDLKWLKKQIN